MQYFYDFTTVDIVLPVDATFNQSIKSLLSSHAIRHGDDRYGQWTGKTSSLFLFIFDFLLLLSFHHRTCTQGKEGNCEWSPKHFFSFPYFSTVTIHAIFHFATKNKRERFEPKKPKLRNVLMCVESEIPHTHSQVLFLFLH